MGSEFSGISQFNFPHKQASFLTELGSLQPKEIGSSAIEKDDIIEDGDSDEEKDPVIPVEKG